MTPGTVFSLVGLVLGTSVCWLYVLFLVHSHHARLTRELLTSYQEMARCTWAVQAAQQGPEVAGHAGSLVAATQPQAVPPDMFGSPMPTEEQLLGIG